MRLMLDKKSCAGRLDSPVRQDIEEAASMLVIDFILNVVLNDRKEIAFAVAGNYIDAHRKGVAFLDSMQKVKVEPADILVVSAGGSPKDIDIFQAHKALEHAKSAIKEGGSIILVAECREGYGNKVFEEWLQFDRDEVIEKFRQGSLWAGTRRRL